MKTRISATIDKEKEEFLEKIIKKELFRNKSHAIEESIKLLMEKLKHEVKDEP